MNTPSRTTTTETTTTMPNGTQKTVRTVVVEMAPPVAVVEPTGSIASQIAVQTVSEIAEVVEKGIAVGQKVKGIFEILAAFTGKKTP